MTKRAREREFTYVIKNDQVFIKHKNNEYVWDPPKRIEDINTFMTEDVFDFEIEEFKNIKLIRVDNLRFNKTILLQKLKLVE